MVGLVHALAAAASSLQVKVAASLALLLGALLKDRKQGKNAPQITFDQCSRPFWPFSQYDKGRPNLILRFGWQNFGRGRTNQCWHLRSRQHGCLAGTEQTCPQDRPPGGGVPPRPHRRKFVRRRGGPDAIASKNSSLNQAGCRARIRLLQKAQISASAARVRSRASVSPAAWTG